MAKKIKYISEYIIFTLLMFCFNLMKAENASSFGGFLGRFFGQFVSSDRIAEQNLKMIFHDKTESEITNIKNGMWENMGRIAGEYPHIKYICRHNTYFDNLEVLENYYKKGKGVILLGAHLANWEIVGTAITMHSQICDKVSVLVRNPNNPYTSKLMKKIREQSDCVETIAKSLQGGRQMMKTLESGGIVGLLIDQKYNEGIECDFFGHSAMTSPAYVKIAQKYGCAVLPTRVIRENEHNFRIVFYDDYRVFDDEGKKISVKKCLEKANKTLESWIIEQPEQWIWLHRRWIKDFAQKLNE